jgi:hypothetical protein
VPVTPTPTILLQQAIWTTLQLDSVLQTGGTSGAPLLILDPNPAIAPPAGSPYSTVLAIFGARLTEIGDPVYPCLTYRVTSRYPQRQFEPPLPGLPNAPIDNFRTDFEIWLGAQSDQQTIDMVMSRLEYNFRNQSLVIAAGSAINPADAGYVFKCDYLTSEQDMYDTQWTKGYYGVASYLFRMQR